MKWISVAGIREAEAIAFAQRNLPSYTAMCRAGASVARMASAMAERVGAKRIVVLSGAGNNGGDGFVAATCLKREGFDVACLLTCVPARLKGDAARAWKDLEHQTSITPRVLSEEELENDAWLDPAVLPRRTLILDALLGIGAQGAPRGVVAKAIHWINRAECPVLAIDVPSGLDADTGVAPGEAVRADATITFSRPKRGFAQASAQSYIGNLTVADIGIPDDLLATYEEETPNRVELLAAPEMRALLPKARERESHKRTYGHAGILGGCDRYPHAPILAARAAYRAGCGLVSLMVPETSRLGAACAVPEAIFADAPEADEAWSDYDALAVGPGWGDLSAQPDKALLLKRLVRNPALPRTVVDADALTALAGMYQEGWTPDISALRLVLTPHPGEAARLLGTTSATIQADRPAAARAIAGRYHAITVLKGNRTLVAEPGGRVRVCMGGNPGMATAGTGDVLAGLIAGLLARGLGAEDAACLGVYLHARAGDTAALTFGEESLVATDLFSTLRV